MSDDDDIRNLSRDNPLAEHENKEVFIKWVYRGHNCGIAQQTRLGIWLGYCQTEAHHAPLQVAKHYEGRVVGEPANEITYVNEDGWVGIDCGHHNQRCVDADGEPLRGTVTDAFSMDAPWFPGDPYARKWGPAEVGQSIESIVDDMIEFEQTL
jgi:hypothetical protein